MADRARWRCHEAGCEAHGTGLTLRLALALLRDHRAEAHHHPGRPEVGTVESIARPPWQRKQVVGHG